MAQCITPVTLKREITRLDGSITDVVPCGKCPPCRSNRAHGWAFRLYNEMKVSSSAAMLTLTYETPPISFNGHATLSKDDWQKFMKRLRKHLGKSNLKYYSAGEYGEHTQRPHYHSLMFNLPHKLLNSTKLDEIWGHGFIHRAPMNLATIYYSLKYLQKSRWEPQTDDDDRDPEFQLMSKRLGVSYLTENMTNYLRELQRGYITIQDGIKIPSPRYFKQKLFDKFELQKIAKDAQQWAEENSSKWETETAKMQWVADQFRKRDKLKHHKISTL